ncbi:hypothetical protein ACFSC3_01560 [Sphingomonas floccifaciens]|uniref:Uncharacterized protein n=1 Tax=Sphingomonas floccifaciens TaxID=1844115 RepID=A0ABW4N956_9SPHN
MAMVSLLSLVAFALFLFALPWLLRKAKPSRSAATGATTLALGLAFSEFLDPAKKVAVERIEKQTEIGDVSDAKSAGAKPSPEA